MTNLIDIDYVDGLSTELTSLDNRVTILEGGGGGGGGITLSFANIADAEAAEFGTAPDYIRVEGYYEAGDGGGALYANPTTVNPSATDQITIDVSGTPYYYRRVHDGAIDLLQHGLVGDGTDETAEFLEAVALAASTGLRKIVCKDRTKTFKVVEAALTGSIEIDLGGATLEGDFNNLYPNTTASILTSNVSSSVDIILRNMTIDGKSTGATSGFGGHPLIDFIGGGLVEADRVILKNGGNRDSTVHASVFDNKQGEFQVKDARIVRIHDSEFNDSPGEALQVMYSGSNEFIKTKLEIDRCKFSKARALSPGNYWSSSHIVAYNVGKGSYIKNCLFGYSIKSAVNWFGTGTIEHCKWEGVRDSQGLDFDETEKFGIDQITVRDCQIQNVTGGYAIRGSARNIIIENVDINRCENGIYIAYASGSHPQFNGVGVQGSRTLYNVYLKNITSNGNDVTDFEGNAVTNTLIKIKGLSSSVPVYLSIEGTGVHTAGESPSANPEYGVYLENTVTKLSGAFQHGRSAMVFATGWNNITIKDAMFYPQPSSTTHVIQSTGTLENLVIEDSRVTSALDPGFYHITVGTVTNKIWRTRSPTFSTINIGGATLVNTN